MKIIYNIISHIHGIFPYSVLAQDVTYIIRMISTHMSIRQKSSLLVRNRLQVVWLILQASLMKKKKQRCIFL